MSEQLINSALAFLSQLIDSQPGAKEKIIAMVNGGDTGPNQTPVSPVKTPVTEAPAKQPKSMSELLKNKKWGRAEIITAMQYVKLPVTMKNFLLNHYKINAYEII